MKDGYYLDIVCASPVEDAVLETARRHPANTTMNFPVQIGVIADAGKRILNLRNQIDTEAGATCSYEWNASSRSSSANGVSMTGKLTA